MVMSRRVRWLWPLLGQFLDFSVQRKTCVVSTDIDGLGAPTVPQPFNRPRWLPTPRRRESDALPPRINYIFTQVTVLSAWIEASERRYSPFDVPPLCPPDTGQVDVGRVCQQHTCGAGCSTRGSYASEPSQVGSGESKHDSEGHGWGSDESKLPASQTKSSSCGRTPSLSGWACTRFGWSEPKCESSLSRHSRAGRGGSQLGSGSSTSGPGRSMLIGGRRSWTAWRRGRPTYVAGRLRGGAFRVRGGAFRFWKKEPPKSTIANSVFNLVNNVAGAGLLTLPGGMAAGTGYMSSVLVCIFLGAASAYTFSLVGLSCNMSGQRSFQGLWAKTLGKRSAWALELGIAVLCFLSAIIYSGIIGDVFTPLLRVAGMPDILVSRGVVISLVTVFVLLPLSLLNGESDGPSDCRSDCPSPRLTLALILLILET
ncbi:unnamed protein product [Discosporangium mesarthrocarpum]